MYSSYGEDLDVLKNMLPLRCYRIKYHIGFILFDSYHEVMWRHAYNQIKTKWNAISRVLLASLHQRLSVKSGATDECKRQSPWCLQWSFWSGVRSWTWPGGNWPIWSRFLPVTASWTLPASLPLAGEQPGWGSCSSWCRSAIQSEIFNK